LGGEYVPLLHERSNVGFRAADEFLHILRGVELVSVQQLDPHRVPVQLPTLLPHKIGNLAIGNEGHAVSRFAEKIPIVIVQRAQLFPCGLIELEERVQFGI
jgi:hypothetical protein